ncbi:2-(1,2-epoxy-1,2-dihydrophenyl)acetyl-CoA isomerase [Thermomonospora echinospora]|uniref:2-(1,2-epoxy-1,2-dihydrophenyl)acetyl-CoA isomerase n=1 Tax=Thermomonospora echinospora TaxID=1992 RepID=A0A1H6DTL7_9ACTN|nr:enoyl-CoA hydratase-related protein [Thermomonospora echinospora]SEG88590.1 2-(1,2-epoxy-1,2-dihydrophenyl)acetyl-CoA isomerase [Thermomonospora echinospora]
MTGEPRCEISGDLLRITLARPDKANAMRGRDMAVVLEALEAVAAGRTARAVLIEGEGRNFCAGADLVSANPPGGDRPPIGTMVRSLNTVAHRVIQTLWDLPVPTVAAVQGRAAAFGLNLALATDFVVAAESATFGYPFAQRGFTADSGATYLLPRLIGVARAKQMLIRGTVVTAPRALEWGLIGEVVPDGELTEAAARLAVELAAGPTFVHGLTKAMISDHLTSDLPRALAAEARTVELSLRGDDFKEGIRAFLGRRPPRFTGH